MISGNLPVHYGENKMKVTLKFDNEMEQYYPRKTLSLVLKENAVLLDLFQAIGSLKSSQLPESIWNYSKDRFRGPVLIISCGKLIKNENEKLYDDQLIELRRCLIGG